jgi:hypothetical protein
VNVTGTVAGNCSNSVQVTSTNGCTGNTAGANLLVRSQICSFTVLKQAGPSSTGPWYSYLTVAVPATLYYKVTVENTGEVAEAGLTVADNILGCSNCCSVALRNPLPVADTSDDDHISSCVLTPSQSISSSGPEVENTATVSSTTGGCSSANDKAKYKPNNPTAVIMGQVELADVKVSDFLGGIGAPKLDASGLRNLLGVWDPAAAAWLEGAGRDGLWQALVDYLDPDSDGQVVVLRWQTLEERGTIGFFAERRQGGAWVRINAEMLPGLIVAPMGAQYWLADPGARPEDDYQYRLIEVEARGTTREYGPFELRAGSAGR